jgi:hypothetical protein
MSPRLSDLASFCSHIKAGAALAQTLAGALKKFTHRPASRGELPIHNASHRTSGNNMTLLAKTRRRVGGLILAAGLSMAWFPATALAWPDRPIRLVVPFAPGGTTDLLGRLFAEGVSSGLGQPVVAINKAGAGGNLGAAEVAHAPADGYTLLVGTPGTQAINPLVYKKTG